MQLREEKAALTARLARLETFGYTHEPTPMSTSLSLMSGQIDRAKLSRANEDLQQVLFCTFHFLFSYSLTVDCDCVDTATEGRE